MSSKNGGNDGSNEGFWSNPLAVGMMLVGLAFIFGGRQIKKGYELGIDVSHQVLKRHDKDVRKIEKRVAKERKEALKEKRREEKLRLKMQKKEGGP